MDFFIPYNSIDRDRIHVAEDFAKFLASMLTDGVHPNPGSSLFVSAGGGWNVNLEPGKCIVGGGHWGENYSQKTFAIDPPSGTLPRIDSFVLRHEGTGTRDIHEAIVKGVPSSVPVAKTLQRDPDAYEICVAQIYVSANATFITQANITDTRQNSKLCGIINSLIKVDADTLFKQYDAIFSQWKAENEALWSDWYYPMKAKTELSAFTFTQWINAFRENNTNEYNAWFENLSAEAQGKFAELESQIRDILDQGTAGALINTINKHATTTVNTESGVHGLRIHNDFVQSFRDSRWSGVRAGNATPDVVGFRASASIDNIALNWEEPEDVTFDGIEFARWEKTKIVYRTDRFPMNEDDGTLLIENTVRNQFATEPLHHTNLVLGQQYYYQAFPVSDANITNRNSTNRTTAMTASLPPDNVTNFTASPGNLQITLTWGDPEDITENTIVIWAGTRIVRKTGDYPDNETDGVIVINSVVRNQYRTVGFVDSGLKNGETYYYQAFPYSTTGAFNRSIDNRVSAIPAGLPPENVIDFVATPGDRRITLKWGDPQDTSGTQPVVWSGTRIVRKTGDYPENEDDGSIVVNNTVRNQYQANGFVDTGLENKVTYYYQAFPYSTTGAFNRNDANRISATPMDQAGIIWTIRTSAADNAWQSVCYGNGLFVAVAGSGTNNRVMTSPDGITWTIRTSAADNNWTSVCYGNGLFVAVAESGTGNRVMTSPDGITWTIRTSAADNNWTSVCYGNGMFVAVAYTGTGNRVMTSSNGITWTIRTSAANNNWTSVCYGNGFFVAVANYGTGNLVMTSSNGTTWTIRTSAANEGWQSVCYGNGMFVAVANYGTGNRVMTSPDGITWTIRTSAADNNWTSVCYGNGMFVAVAYTGTGNRVMTSSNGITWTIRTSAADNSWTSVCYDNGVFVAVSSSGTGNRVMTSGEYNSLSHLSSKIEALLYLEEENARLGKEIDRVSDESVITMQAVIEVYELMLGVIE